MQEDIFQMIGSINVIFTFWKDREEEYRSHVIEAPNCYGNFLEETDDCFGCPWADECEEESAKDDWDANEIYLEEDKMQIHLCPKCGSEMEEKSADAFARESYWECPKCHYRDVIPWDNKGNYIEALEREIRNERQR